MRKKQDIMWEQSTLWESVEKWVTKYLKKNHSEYCERQVKAMRLVLKNSIMKKRTGEVRLPSDQDEKINVIEKPIIKKGH